MEEVPDSASKQNDSTTTENNPNGNVVELYLYDLSRGMAKSLSSAIVGQQIDGIWHTSIVVYGREYFFGGSGIQNIYPGTTILGQPLRKYSLGHTEIPEEVFLLQIQELSDSVFQHHSYDIFVHNCNIFSNEVAQFLVGKGIPKFILDLPNTVLNSPLGQLLKQFYDQSLLRQRGGYDPNPFEILIRERVLQVSGLNATMGDREDSPLSDEGTPPPRPNIKRRDLVAEVEEEERKEREEKKKNREPPIVFRELGREVNELLDELEKSLCKVELNDEEMRCLKELREYALGDEGSWVLSDDFLNLIGRILLSGEAGIGDDSREYCCKILAWLAVTKDDVILVLHQDRRDHVIMRYASNVDQMSPKCQEAVAYLLCNLFENLSTSEWLLYISEWENDTRGLTSNIRVTTKVGVHALLSKEFKDVGSALVYNMVSKERLGETSLVRSILPAKSKSKVFDDVAVEMALALLQFLSERPPETLIWRGLKSLLRCCQLARAEVPALVKMVGPPPTDLKGTSGRCDELVKQIDALLKGSA